MTRVIVQEGVWPTGTYNGCKDNYIDKNNITSNYGGNAYCIVNDDNSSLIAFAQLQDIIPSGITITNAALKLMARDTLQYAPTSTGTMHVFQCLKPWQQLTSTWQNWKTTILSSFPWGQNGARSGDLSGQENSSSSQPDRKSLTYPSTIGKLASYTWSLDFTKHQTVISGVEAFSTLVGEYVSGVYTDSRGFILEAQTNNPIDMSFYSSEESDSSKRPILIVDYE
jgi:hypothetical protein